MAEELNPLTGLPLGQTSPTVDTTTGEKRKINPLTGKPLGSISTSPGVTIGGPAGFTTSAMSTSDYNIRRKDDISKYTSYGVPLGQDLDWDEIRARNQSTAEQWGRGLAKAYVTAQGAVVENTLGVVAGLGSMVMGGSYYDNSVGRAVDNANEWMRENYANYTTEAERNMSTLQKMGTANFWADTVANGIGYSVGSIATMYLTGGMGAVGMLGKAAKLGSLYKASKAIATGAKLANTLQKGAKGARMLKAAQMADAALLMGLAESSVEARETKKGVMEDLTAKYMQENGLDYEWQIPDDELEDIEKTAVAAGNTNFVANLAITTGTNMAMFGKMALGFKAAAKSNKDVVWDAVARKAKNQLSDRSRWQKAIDLMKPVAENGLEEGLQEGLQFASNIYSTEYHIGKMHDAGSGDRMKALSKALSGTIGNQEGRESILVGLLTGMVMGGAGVRGQAKARAAAADRLTQTINAGYFNNIQSKEEGENLSSITVQLMDKALKEGNIREFKNLQNQLVVAQGLNAINQGGFEVMLQKLEDSKSLEDAEFAKMYGYSTELAEGQTFSDVSGGESKAQIIDNLKAKLENVKNTYDRVTERFPVPEKTKGLPRLLMSKEEQIAEDKVYEEQLALRNELVFRGAEVRDRNKRQKDIIAEMQQRIDTDPILQDSGINVKSEIAKVYTPSQDFAFTEEDPDGSKTLEARDKNVRSAMQRVLDVVEAAGGDVQGLRGLASDYLGLQSEQRRAINAYNRLSSDPFYQQRFKDEVDTAKRVMAERRMDKQVDEAIETSATAEELIANSPSKDLTTDAQKAKLRARYKELQKQQNAARQQFKEDVKGIASLEDKLAALKAIKTDELSPIERAGLVDAIRDIQAAIDERDNVEEKSPEETANELLDAGVDEGGESGYLALEELSGMESLSEDGRMLKINGKVYYNYNADPTDAIERSKSGKIRKVRLVDSEGNRHTFYNTNNNQQADAIAYHIMLAELAKAEGQPTVNKETALREKAIADKMLAEKLEKTATAGKHGAKNSTSLRQEIYELERLLQAALEAHDNLRQIYITEAGATKEDLKNDPELAPLAKKLRSLRAQIAARKRVLKARGETVVATSEETLRAENNAREAIKKLKRNLTGFTTEEALNDQRLEEIENELEQMKNASRAEQLSPEFSERRRALQEEKRVITQINEEIDEKIKFIEGRIKLHQATLKRIYDELNEPQSSGEEAQSTDAENAQRQAAEQENRDRRERSEVERTPVEKRLIVGDSKPLETVAELMLRLQKKYMEAVGAISKVPTVLLQEIQRFLDDPKRMTVERANAFAQQLTKYLTDAQKKKWWQVERPKLIKRAKETTEANPIVENKKESKQEKTPAPTSNSALKTEKEVKTGVRPTPPTAGPAAEGRVVETLNLEEDSTAAERAQQTPTDEFAAARDAAQQKEGATADLNAVQDEKVARDVEQVVKILNESNSVEDAVQKLLEGGHILSWTDDKNVVHGLVDPIGGRDALYIKVGNVVVPFYRSSKGTSDKTAGEWYPFFFPTTRWLAKAGTDNYKEGYGNSNIQAIANALNANLKYKEPKATYTFTTIDDVIGAIRALFPSISEKEAYRIYEGSTAEIYSAMFDVLKNWNDNLGGLKLDSMIEQMESFKNRVDDQIGRPNGLGGFYSEEDAKEEKAIFDNIISKIKSLIAQTVQPSPSTSEQSEVSVPEVISLPNRPAAVPPRDPEPKAKTTIGNDLGVRMANSNQEIGVEYLGGNKYVVAVDSEGRRTTQYPTLNGTPLIPNTNLLIHSPEGTEVEFEIIEDSWFTGTYGENADPLDHATDVPVYVKIGGEIVGKLEASDSADRRVIVEKLSSNERVTSNIARKQVGVGAINHTRVTEGVDSPQVYFNDPADVFNNETLQGSPLRLAVVSKALGASSWATNDPGLDGRIGATTDDLTFSNLASGQVGFVVQEQDSGDGSVKVIPASTANLTSAAQAKVLENLKKKDFQVAAEIVANSKADDSIFGENYLHFGQFEDESVDYLIYRSPATGELVRINEDQMSKALNNGDPMYNFVKFDPSTEKFGRIKDDKLYKAVNDAGGLANDFKKFLENKKYHVDLEMMNSNSGYISAVTGMTYSTYQDYLFDSDETGDIEGRQGYSSIVSTDVSIINGSIFNSPGVEFEKGSIIDNTEEAASSTPPVSGGISLLSADDVSALMGDDFLSDLSKDELEEDCDLPPFKI